VTTTATQPAVLGTAAPLGRKGGEEWPVERSPRGAEQASKASSDLRRLLTASSHNGGSMPNYLVTWTIDIEADSPTEAALAALAIQRKADSIAVVFKVRDKHTRTTTLVDLDPDDDCFACDNRGWNIVQADPRKRPPRRDSALRRMQGPPRRHRCLRGGSRRRLSR
jgi:hypothetical protein